MTFPCFAAPLRALAAITLVALAATTVQAEPGKARKRRKPHRKTPPQLVQLDGEVVRVNWNDGDTFRVTTGKRKGDKARLTGYNTLESYGPVHFWGDFHGWELYRVHTAATELARARKWTCTSNGGADHYGRMLVDCPELRAELIARGLAHIYTMEGEADAELLKLQLAAQAQRLGMWAKGIPVAIVTSVHSVDEGKPGAKPRTSSYNRLCDTSTGRCFTVEHTKVFRACDVFCHSGSCMLYVPFQVRYGDKRPACVLGEAGERNRMTAAPHLHQP